MKSLSFKSPNQLGTLDATTGSVYVSTCLVTAKSCENIGGKENLNAFFGGKWKNRIRDLLAGYTDCYHPVELPSFDHLVSHIPDQSDYTNHGTVMFIPNFKRAKGLKPGKKYSVSELYNQFKQSISAAADYALEKVQGSLDAPPNLIFAHFDESNQSGLSPEVAAKLYYEVLSEDKYQDLNVSFLIEGKQQSRLQSFLEKEELHAKFKEPNLSNKEKLTKMIDILIYNIELRANGRRTGYYNQWKVGRLQGVRRVVTGESFNGQGRQLYDVINDLKAICAQKRNSWDLFSTPKSLNEFSTLLSNDDDLYWEYFEFTLDISKIRTI